MLRDKVGGHPSDHEARDAVNTTDKDEHGDISCSLVGRGDADESILVASGFNCNVLADSFR